MKKSDVIQYFDGSQTAVAKFLDIRPSAVCQWPDRVPEKSANRLVLLTKGAKRNGVVLRLNLRAYLTASAA